MKEKNYVHIGIFGQPQGLQGNIKINILTSSLESFKVFKKYFIGENKSALAFKKIKKIGKKIVVSIDNCGDRDKALTYKGIHIFTLRENFPEIKNDEYYVLDLIGSDVFDINNNSLGVVEDVKNFGAGDLMEIKNLSKKKFYIPMNKENLISINIDRKTIIIDPIKGLLE